jgi:8-oxo-dGTP pyrophosphatase MutT (NUDIX family)
VSTSTRTDRAAAVEAAVLVGVFRYESGELGLVLVRRAGGGLHGGQIAFPGGKREPQDAALADTAIRETHEEIGLVSSAVEIVEALPPVDTLTSGFRIAPFLARIERPSRWLPDPREVAQVLEVALDDLLDPAAHDEETRTFANWPEPRRIPYYRVGEDKLWGATYRIAHPLLPRLAANEWKI